MRRWRAGVWGTAALILLAAGIANQSVTGFNWSLGDFLVAGAMLALACLGWEFAARAMHSNLYRAGAALAVVGSLALVWVNLAVGIIGDPDNRANLLFFAVLAVGGGLALAGHLRAAGMKRALIAMAVLQAILAAAILLAGLTAAGLFCLVFAGIWAASAYLFRLAASRAA
ncbi:hypothetical protein [Novosphingobium sp.]|uniref:hypothetical protein n=1 Tax=Novosphingobium sp. TaxID=1874826 RepID=UPI0035B1C8A1